MNDWGVNKLNISGITALNRLILIRYGVVLV